MELTYRAAVPADLDAVFRLVTDAIAQMERQGIRQWDSIYPAKADFRQDIEERQHQGLAHAALLHIEQEARRRGCKAVRLDVFSENPYARRLYASLSYCKVGTAFWRKGKFYLLEKLL